MKKKNEGLRIAKTTLRRRANSGAIILISNLEFGNRPTHNE